MSAGRRREKSVVVSRTVPEWHQGQSAQNSELGQDLPSAGMRWGAA